LIDLRKFVHTYKVPLEDVCDIQFSFLNVTVKTEKLGGSKNQLALNITIQGEAEAYDSVVESSRYSRPSLLVTLGVLSFISGRAFTVYDVTNSSSSFFDNVPSAESLTARFVLNNLDYSSALEAICCSINNEKSHKNTLLFSLLDRWRKALSQLIESEGQGLLEDESLLSFFHVLELLAAEYNNDQQRDADEQISLFLNGLMVDTLKLSGPSLDQKIKEKTKIIKSLLLGSDLMSVASRINYMLGMLGLLDERTKNLVKRLVDARNSIAHGRQVFRDRVTWPLPPFFMLHSDFIDLGGIISVLTARVIARHYDLELWGSEWGEVLSTLSPPPHVVKKFISDESYKGIEVESFCAGLTDQVTPASIIETYINGYIDFSELEQSLGCHVEGIMALTSEAESDDKLYMRIFLADANDSLVAEYCRKSLNMDCVSRSLLKDCLRCLEHYKVKTSWFRNWVVGGMASEDPVVSVPGAD
jgi:hypothetical protein